MMASLVDKHHKYRCRDLKRQLEELEEYNEMLAVKLLRSQKRLRRMKIERNVLLERFEQTRHYRSRHDDDDYTGSDSDAPLKNTFPHQNTSDMEANEAGHRSGNAASARTAATGRGRRRGAGALGQTRSSAGTPQPQSANSTGTHESTTGAALATTSRRARTEKDPHAPKRPANAFVMYCQDERPNIRKKGTDLSYSEMTKAMGQKWKNLPQEEKKKYYDLYERGMFRYQQELEVYRGGGGGGAGSGTYDNNDNEPVGTSAAGSPSLAGPSAESGGTQMAVQPYSARSEPSVAVDAGRAAAGDFGNNVESVSQNGDMDVDRSEESVDGDANMAGMHGGKDEPVSTTETVVMAPEEGGNVDFTKQQTSPMHGKPVGYVDSWYGTVETPRGDGLATTSPTVNGVGPNHHHHHHHHRDNVADAGVNGRVTSPHNHAAPSAMGQQPSS
ncbi:non-histone protein [Coemansia interrupta]|uniref:Non-histone protein n=1 Tax=Coemansia interrupta TaxID=1126814 RepID=A0A9W8HKY1_9FUNG|nr:non-histone protein [Coemansia interrupta]